MLFAQAYVSVNTCVEGVAPSRLCTYWLAVGKHYITACGSMGAYWPGVCLCAEQRPLHTSGWAHVLRPCMWTLLSICMPSECIQRTSKQRVLDVSSTSCVQSTITKHLHSGCWDGAPCAYSEHASGVECVRCQKLCNSGWNKLRWLQDIPERCGQSCTLNRGQEVVTSC